MSILRPKSISFSAAQSGVSTSLQEKKATLQEFKEKGPNKNRRRTVSLFLRISGGSARTRERRSDETRQMRAAAQEEKKRLSRHACGHFVSRAFHSKDQEKRDTVLSVYLNEIRHLGRLSF